MPTPSATAPSLPLIDPALAAFMSGGVSLGLGSAASAAELLADLRGGAAALAALCSLPSTHRTVQLEAPSARIAPATPVGWALATRYVQAFGEELARLGWAPEFTTALLTWPPGELMAIVFESTEAYDQTPGGRFRLRVARPLQLVELPA